MAKLTQDQINVSHAWLHDVFVWGNLLKTPIRDIKNYNQMYGNVKSPVGKKNAEIICNAIKNRIVDYKNFKNEYDLALVAMSIRSFIPDLHEKNPNANSIFVDKATLAKFIANFCAENKYYWDDSKTTTYEMDQIKETTLGKALWEFGCFSSQKNQATQNATTNVAGNTSKQTVSTQAAPSQTGSAQTTQSATPQNKTAGAQPSKTVAPTAQSTSTKSNGPKNDYKSTGAQSANVKCLVGKPNNKIQVKTTDTWCIEADKTGKNTPNIFIKPLDDAACPQGIAKIYMGSGNGYTDCKCWFDDKTIATLFLNKCTAKFGTNFKNIHLAKKKSDSNGYYEVKTEFGNCFIKASKLNETLQEEIEETKNTIAKEIETDFNSFEEAFYKEL